MPSVEDKDRGIARWAVTSGVWFLVGILLITIALIFTSREERLGFPSVTNVRASGFAAFAELLVRDGYTVELERSVRPDFQGAELVIATSFNENIPSTLGEMIEAESEQYEPTITADLPYEMLVKRHVEQGGTVMRIVNRRNFEMASKLAESARSVESAHDSSKVFLLSLPYSATLLSELPYEQHAYFAWFVGEDGYLSYTGVGEGLLVTVSDGLPITNRFLDQQQNAQFFLDAVHAVAKPGSRIVFYEAGIGNSESPTVANTLGPWAVAARTQAIFLFVVLIVTFGKRFGQPIIDRRRVRGSRELFDAVADVFRRTGNTGLALDHLLIECDLRMRSVMRLPSNVTRHDMLSQAPKELREQYLNVSELAVSGASPNKAAEAAAKLLGLLQGFEHDSRPSRGLKR
ncbi:MAG: hypothetical protein WD716_10475 [Fimbriimonadaceae bacterium]